MLCQSALCALVLVLAVVAAGVAGSIAARRGKHLNAWFAFTLENETQVHQILTTGPKYEHAANPQRERFLLQKLN